MSMIETATRAFVAKLSDDRLVPWVDDDAGLSSVVLDGQFDLLEAMRAAIAALRVPTFLMLGAPGLVYADNGGESYPQLVSTAQIEDIWQAMIDAALAEPTTGE